jgi:2',3'-cyclic-nucleotide 2'-phosphodiesterase/3'-nucleotidase/5'-nucleotidase
MISLIAALALVAPSLHSELALSSAQGRALPPQDSAHVVLVATTDIHGHATDWDYLTRQSFPGGLARVATVVDSLKTLYPGQVIVADAGDLLQGDPFATYFGRVAPRDPNPLIEAMNLAGYDVATLGNHEFDWGLAAMRRAIAGAAFPYVSGNLHTLAGDTLLYPPYVVLQRQGVRVGVAGFTTPGVMVWDREQVRGKVRVERILAAAARVMESLRRESDLAIVLIHSGMDGPASYDTAGIGAEHAAAALASLPVRPDIVVVGHSHREMRDSVLGRVHFVQPRPYGGSVSVTHIDLARVDERWRPIRIRSDLISTAQVIPSARLMQRLAPAHAAVVNWVDTVVGRSSGPMRAAAARAEPTPILNFINAVQRKRTGADLSAASAFDLRAGFDSGAIRLGQVLALYPYENTLRAVRITGAQLKDYLEHSVLYFRTDPIGRVSINDSVAGYNYDVVAGARYDIDLRRGAGDRIRNLSVRGRPVRPTDSFTLALSSYRQSGAGGYTMLRDAPVVYDKAESIRDLLTAEIGNRGELNPAEYADREWRIVPEATASAVKALFHLPAQPLSAGPRDTVVLRILATGDLHGALSPSTPSGGKPAGGVAALAGLMDSLAADCGCPTLRLDAGDAMQGTVVANVTRGRAMVEVLNRLNLTAATLGEHDLEWSLDTLRRRMSEARYPWVAANIFDSASGGRPVWIAPYRMVKAGELTVAVVGYITAETKASVKPEFTAGLRFGDGPLAIHDVLAEVRAQRPDLTILLAHAGATCQGPICNGEVVRIVEGVESRTIDLLIAGHSSGTLNIRVLGVPIVAPGSDGSSVAVADVVKTTAGGREVRTRIEPVSPETVTENAGMAELVEAYRRKADSLTSRVVAKVKFPLTRTGDQYRLGGLIAEARRNLLRADVGLVTNAAIRADLPAGPVTYGQLFEIQPSQNDLVKVTLSGARLREVLEQSLDQSGRPTAQVAGVKVRYDPRRPLGHRLQAVELLGRRKLRPEDTYTLAVNDFLGAGGDGYTMLVGLPAEPASMLDVEALIAYLRRLRQPVQVTPDPGFVSTRR